VLPLVAFSVGVSALLVLVELRLPLRQPVKPRLGKRKGAKASGIVGAANAGVQGTQNMLQLAGYGLGQVANHGNDLANYFKPQQAPTTGWDSWTEMG